MISWTTAGMRTGAIEATIGDGTGGYGNSFMDTSAPITIRVMRDATINYLDIDGATNLPDRYHHIRLVP